MSQQLLVDLFAAYYAARRNKRKSVNAARFEVSFETNLFRLYEEIQNRTYKISPSIAFIVNQPIQREVFAADFRDRVVHHLVYTYLNPLCERMFIYDSYSCRKGKGTSLGKQRLNHFIRSCSQNYTTECYILKVDILGYFMNMNRDILFHKVEHLLDQYYPRTGTFDIETVRWLLHKIIYNNPIEHCHIKGGVHSWGGLPRSKSLFYADENNGFPIGNLTSQLFANIYLHNFDFYIQQRLGCQYYGRYVDDMVLVHQDKEWLSSSVPRIQNYLESQLGLSLHPYKIYLQPCTHGVVFLGEIHKPGRRYVGKRTRQSLYRFIRYWNTILEEAGGILSLEQVQTIVSSLNSYLGSMKLVQSYRLRVRMLQKFTPLLWKYVGVNSSFTYMYIK